MLLLLDCAHCAYVLLLRHCHWFRLPCPCCFCLPYYGDCCVTVVPETMLTMPVLGLQPWRTLSSMPSVAWSTMNGDYCSNPTDLCQQCHYNFVNSYRCSLLFCICLTYCVVLLQPGDAFFNCIVRLDIKSGEHQVWAEEGTYPGEPIFVPRPGATAEDDGVLLSVVLAGTHCVGQTNMLALHV